MLKLIIGVKGTGKTKQLIEMVNTASGEFDPTDVVWFRIANHNEIDVTGKTLTVKTKAGEGFAVLVDK